MMNFEIMAKKFLSITSAMKISSSAQCLYFQLLNFFDKKFWPEAPLEIDNMTIHNNTGLSRQQIKNSRDELQKLGLIFYEKGSGSRSGKYTMIDIQNAQLQSIIDISNINEVKIDNLAALSNEVDKLAGDYRVWGQYILRILQKAIEKNTSGIYNNFYATSQLFLKASDTLKWDTLQKIMSHLRYKPDIQNREAYILTIIANEVKALQKNQKQSLV